MEKGEHAPAASLSLLERESCARLYEGASLLTTADAGAALFGLPCHAPHPPGNSWTDSCVRCLFFVNAVFARRLTHDTLRLCQLPIVYHTEGEPFPVGACGLFC